MVYYYDITIRKVKKVVACEDTGKDGITQKTNPSPLSSS
jgi:hypothetical protein